MRPGSYPGEGNALLRAGMCEIMMHPQEIRNWLNTVDEQGSRYGWTDYKAYRNHCLNKLTSEDREDILEYLESYDD